MGHTQYNAYPHYSNNNVLQLNWTVFRRTRFVRPPARPQMTFITFQGSLDGITLRYQFSCKLSLKCQLKKKALQYLRQST